MTSDADGAPRETLLVVTLPALNEEATIAGVVGAIPREIPGVDRVQVVVVDDGSSDRTAELAGEAGALVARHPVNLGVGGAFQTGLETALELGASYLVNIDADGQFDPSDIPALLRPVLTGDADFATCSRFKDPALVPSMPWVKLRGNAAVAIIVSTLLGRRFHDVACGFRAFNRSALLNMNLFGQFTYTQETFIDLAFKGLRIVEVPLRVRGEREFGKSRVASSILRYAIQTSRIIFSTFKDYRPFAFFAGVATVFGLPGVALGLFFGGHYLSTGSFSPHLWAGFTSAFLVGASLVFGVVAVTVESQARLRMTLERLLYHQKKHHYEHLGRRGHPEDSRT